jgi:hypothetical protein
VSGYQLHRCVYDWVRAGETGDAGFDVARYELTDVERSAFEDRDVARLYRLGLHPVLLNRFARAAGYARDDYRQALEPYATPDTRRGRWQT